MQNDFHQITRGKLRHC